jgi:chromate transport protein ChrA
VGYFLKGMQAGIAAVIVDVIYKMAAGFVKKKDILSMALMAAAFCLSYFLEINVILIIAGAIALGTAYHFCAKAVKAKKQKRQAERTDSNGAQDLPIDKKNETDISRLSDKENKR